MYKNIFLKKKKRITPLLSFLIFVFNYSFAQVNNSIKPKITLDQLLEFAVNNSLDAYKAKKKYGINYWSYKSFNSNLLPKITFETQPLSYNRSVIKRYDSEQNIDVYRSQQNLNSYANISINQNIIATGTNVFINSSLNRLANFGEANNEIYNATPFIIGLNQPLMAFNPLKWDNKIAPIKYKQAYHNYAYDIQTVNLKAVNLFFKWALADQKFKIAKENKISAEKLFKIGKKRYKIGSIVKEDILNLELDVYNATTNVAQNEQNLQKVKSELKLFLRNSDFIDRIPELPELISNFQINVKNAVSLAKENSPNNLDRELKKLEAQRDLDRAIKENRFDLSINASYGFNQQANTLNKVYRNFLEQEMLSLHFNIPILDWGERKNKVKIARMNKALSDAELQQNKEQFEQDITLKIKEFNLQKELVNVALLTSKVAKEAYSLTERRYLSGRVDLLQLASTRRASQTASENYIKSLQNYWKLYYEVQQFTLYDFFNKKDLIRDLNVILE